MKFFSKTIGVVFAAAVFFAGCAAGGAAPAGQSEAAQNSTWRQSGAQQPMGQDAAPDGPQAVTVRLVTPPIQYCGEGNGNDAGFYYLDHTGNEGPSLNIRFIDYATAQDVYLSSDPSADHRTPEDPSYLESLSGGGTVFPAGDRLYVLQTGEPGVIYQMNLDGSERRQLYKGADSEMLNTAAAFDGASLYCTAQRVVMIENEPQLKSFLVKMDTQSGETADLCELKPNAYLIGAADSCLVLQSITEGDPSPDGLPNIIYEILLYSFETSSLEEIRSWPGDQMLDVRVYENCLITGDIYEKTVRVQRLSTGEEMAVYSIEPFISPEYTRLWGAGVRDGKYYFEDGSTGAVCYTDIFTGAQGYMTLTYDNALKGDTASCEIYAQTDTQYLVLTGYETQKRTGLDKAGTAVEVEEFRACYALIGKEDFWNSVPDYRPVTFVG